MGYIRWYDWRTDMASAYLKKDNSHDDQNFLLDPYGEGVNGRGLMAWNLGEWRSRWMEQYKNGKPGDDIWVKMVNRYIGVKFMPPTDFVSNPTTYANGIDVACDVSRHFDGESADHRYLLHEPTIGTRYIFHIYPAQQLADAIAEKAANFTREHQKERHTSTYNLFEDNGRVAVSLNDGKGKFSLRMNLHNVDSYYIKDAGGNLVQCDRLRWDIYYRDAAGLWLRQMTPNASNTLHIYNGDPYDYEITVDQTKNKIGSYTIEDIAGEYTLVIANAGYTVNTTKQLTWTNLQGESCHLVGVMGNGTTEAPVIHYDLEFLNASPLTLAELNTEANQRRQRLYLESNYTWANTLSFDNYFVINQDDPLKYAEPTTATENYSRYPGPWDEAEYEYCYPQLYAQNGTSTMLYSNGWQGWGLSPLHGDYTLLKSMNRKGVSEARTDDDPQLAHQTYHAYWYQKKELYDITHAFDPSKWGTFLYVDASDESRTIATLHFSAKDICVGSEFYYTAFIADMTDGNGEAPQVLFRVSAIDHYHGDAKIPVVSFLTGDFNSVLQYPVNNVGAPTDPDQRGQWYQVFGHATIPYYVVLPAENADGTHDFVVEIDNYAVSTRGADYAIDEISFYTCAAQIQMTQSDTTCDTNDVETNIFINLGNLQSTAMGTTSSTEYMYYRIYEYVPGGEDKLITGIYTADNVTNQLDNQPKQDGVSTYDGTYGIIKLAHGTVPESDDDLADDGKTLGPYRDATSGNLYYRLVHADFPLESNKQYYVSIAEVDMFMNNHDNFRPDAKKTTDAKSIWGNPDDKCSIFSEPLLTRKIFVQLTDEDDKPINLINSDCRGWTTQTFNTQMEIPNAVDDSGFTTFSDLPFDYYVGPLTDINTEGNAIKGAIADYRTKYPTTVGLDEGYKDVSAYNYAILKPLVDRGQLLLSCSPTFEYEFSAEGQYTFVTIPAQSEVVVNKGTDKEKTVLFCNLMAFTVNYTVTHPVLELGFQDVDYPALGYSRRVVRLGREQMADLQGTFKLHIPVRSYRNKGTRNKLYTVPTLGLQLVDTNDPTVTVDNVNPTVIAALNTADIDRTADANKMHLDFSFNNSVNFHEGYQYTVRFYYYDEEDHEESNRCETEMEFILKMVPEYATWTGADGTTEWNNDRNWQRSTQAILYKDRDGQNTDDYKDYDGGNGRPSETPQTYVPMKFTKVTVPTDIQAPVLYDLTTAANDIYDNLSADATMNIQYDMMVRTEKTCQDHSTPGNVYDCEKFYANWAKELYLKPGAGLLGQHYLTYERVWVERELDANTWSLLSTPLQNTYAGDMYVPYATGRQETEAFRDINFVKATYSRTRYPFYQHSWGMNAMVHDLFRNDFSAQLPYTTVTTAMAEWSHTYNDVQTPYTELMGFALRAHKQPQAKKTLLRLPKADTSYDYYQYDDAAGNDVHNVAKQTTGKLLTDGQKNIVGTTYGVKYRTQARTAGNGTVSIAATQLHTIDGYALVGNPYTASGDMKKFLEANTGLESSYWTYADNTATTHSVETAETIAPMQAFFVKFKDGATAIQFTPDMTIDGHTTTVVAPARWLTITASSADGSSVARVMLNDDDSVGENVATLLDDNLAAVPMVYTVGDGRALAEQRLTSSAIVPLCVETAREDADVALRFEGAEALGGALSLYDALTRQTLPLTSDLQLSVTGRSAGRYYLVGADAATVSDAAQPSGLSIYAAQGVLHVLSAAGPIARVEVFTPAGTVVYEAAPDAPTHDVQLGRGVYIVRCKTAGCKRIVKIEL